MRSRNRPAAEQDEDGRWRARLELVALFALVWCATYFFLSRSPLLYDNDSYYHLAVAKTFSEQGIVDELSAVRASAMSAAFGDKELGLHLFLVPFVSWFEPVRGGQLALATLISTILVTISGLARGAFGRWAYLLPIALLWLSPEVAWRLVRLRAELLSILLFLLSLAVATQRRERWLAPLGLLFAVSYTAFHAYLGLFGLLFAWRGLVRREWNWPLVLYPTLGVLLGLVVHPHFPDNLTIWVLQSFDFFQGTALLDVGTEIRPNLTSTTLLVNLGFYVLLTALLLARRNPASTHPRSSATLPLDVWGLATFVFVLLYLLMSRFSLYAFPFALLFVAALVQRRGLAQRCALPGGYSVPLFGACLVAAAVATPEALRQVENYRQRTDPGPEQIRLRDRESLAAALPAGAKVAARWQQTPIYMLWAPQAHYLNVLDPIFMARPFPQAHAVQEAIFSGREPDVPWQLIAQLDSRYLAFSLAAPTGALARRAIGDPRLVVRHYQANALFEVVGLEPNPFVVDWQPRAVFEPTATLPREAVGPLAAYVRLPAPVSHGEDGSAGDCATRTTSFQLEERASFEFAPWGPATLSADGRRLIEIGASLHAVLGEGVQFELDAGDHQLTVTMCGLSPEAPNGFFLLRR